MPLDEGGRSGHFSLNVDPGHLVAAEARLAGLHDFLAHGSARLATVQGDSSGWTGAAATACLGETTTISTTLTRTAPKVHEAGEAVRIFRMALETAQETTLPRLNSRWAQAETDYDTEAVKAGRVYVSEVGSQRNMPEEDARPARVVAVGVRDRAVQGASVARAGSQKGLNGDYDAMISSLEQAARACGTALAALVPITFTADQWTKVKGGHIPMGMLASLRSQVFGRDSFVGQSDGNKAGEYVAGKLDSQAKNGKPGEPLDPEVVALMDQLKRDPAFAQALLTDLGPGGAAFLSMRARGLYESPGGAAGKEQGRQLLRILTDVYATGSRVQVTTDDGQSKPLMDQKWLDNFNPASYDAAGEAYKRFFGMPAYVSGYRPDLLLPFMTKAGAFSSDLSQLVTQQALDDYEKGSKLDSSQDAVERWQLYRGNDDAFTSATATRAVLDGDSGNPFRTELFHIALERTAENPFASNAVMMTHRDTMLQLMTGKADWLTGGQNRHDWGSQALASILEKATVGSQSSNMVSADAVLWGVGDYLNKHPGEHLVKNVQLALGDVVMDKRFMNGAMSSVTGQFGQLDGFRDDPSHPEMGPLMHKDLWAALHQEAMRQPDTAAKIMLEVGSYIDGTGDRADEFGYSWNQSKGEWDPDSSVTFVEQLQSAAARQFLRANLKAASEGIKAELETELEQNGKDRELAEGILGSMVGWAMDPASVAGDVTGKLTDFVVKSAVEQAMPTEGIHDRYDAKIRSFDAMLDDGVIRDNPWTRVGKAGDALVNDVVGGRVNTEIEAPPQGSVHPTLEAPRVFDGDPRTYVGHLSAASPGAGIPPQTDDFLIYGTDDKPAGIKAFGEMNPAQREAYTKWLHDPAVQKYLATKLTPKAAAEVLVTP